MNKLVLATLACLALAIPANAATPTLTGTVGPGFTITLTKGGTKVTTLKAGTYRLVVKDRSAIHDFHLKGPGIDRRFTGVAFVGTKTFPTVKLTKGIYTYVCTPHKLSMHGKFTVK